jgi:hypothetical protein
MLFREGEKPTTFRSYLTTAVKWHGEQMLMRVNTHDTIRAKLSRENQPEFPRPS